MTTQNREAETSRSTDREAAVAALSAAMFVIDNDAQGEPYGRFVEGDEALRRLENQGYAIVPAAQDSDALRAALKWALNALTPYPHPPECSPSQCRCGYAVARAALGEAKTSGSSDPEAAAEPHRDYAGRTCTTGLMHSHQPAASDD